MAKAAACNDNNHTQLTKLLATYHVFFYVHPVPLPPAPQVGGLCLYHYVPYSVNNATLALCKLFQHESTYPAALS